MFRETISFTPDSIDQEYELWLMAWMQDNQGGEVITDGSF